MVVFTLPLAVPGGTRELHLAREVRERFALDESLFGIRGDILFAHVDEARRLAGLMNETRDLARHPQLAVRAGDLFAAALIHELQHLLVAAVARRAQADPLERAMTASSERAGEAGLEELLQEFAYAFPASAVQRGEVGPGEYLEGSEDGVPNRRVVFEELLLLRLAASNPALERLRDLFDDYRLREKPGYLDLLEGYRDGSAGIPAADATAMRLLELLEAPQRANPTSLAGQLRYIKEHWQEELGEHLERLLGRVLLSLDVMAEEGKHGFVGAFESAPPLGLEDLAGPDVEEYEAFSADAEWMRGLVLLAKSTFVWLDQLSKRYGRHIATLDAIPDEELDELAARGFTGLWLIGLWERSEASRRIKHLRGQPDAAASAYALYDYRIASELGGEEAYRKLRERAMRRGIRLASDMVPNHVGIDGRWVIENPDWFVQLPQAPYPGYSFTGPDLSSHEDVGIFLEDHYYDSSDAAVVFKRLDHRSGQSRYIYHGNDGTAMPWNDTAQLDYLNPEVREAVIRTIIEVAKRFPVIRFDAAMTLAKQHIRRLWYPEPGQGGAVPSRAEHGSMPRGEFERRIPEEFWREVVDRVAQEVPDTLLLAEAFWMMEGYFVRTLGMHRVYNSAFMNMLKREANAEYRLLLRNVLEFDPQILARFVNFMNNPDEDTAVAQFGKDDKYFGVCTVMSTMPGLPMFGHGQVEGFEEKYGMEFRRARREEIADPWLLERHRREIFPLLHRRRHFAGIDGFLLYDFVSDDGSVAEDVIAYSNWGGNSVSLVVFHNRYAEVSGRLHMSVPYNATIEGERRRHQRSLFEGLGLTGGPGNFVAFRDFGSGLEHLIAADELQGRGLEMRLEAYRYRVLLDFRELSDSESEPYAELCRELAGRGVPSVHDAVKDLRLRPLFDTFGDLLDTPARDSEALLATYRDFLVMLARFGYQPEKGRAWAQDRFEALLDAWEAHCEASGSPREQLSQLEIMLLAWMALEPLHEGTYQRFRLEQEVAAGNHSPEEPYEADLFAEALPLLLTHAPAAARGGETRELLRRLLEDPRSGELLRFHVHEGDEYFNREAYRVLGEGTAVAGSILQLADTGVSEGLVDRLALLRRIEEGSDYLVDRLRKRLTSAAKGRGTAVGGRSDG